MDEVLITRRGKTGGRRTMLIEVLKLSSHGDSTTTKTIESKIGSVVR